MPQHIFNGWTEPLEYALEFRQPNSDVVAAISLVGCTVTMLAKDKSGQAVTLAGGGAMTITDAEAGKIRYSPTGTEFEESGSPYAVVFRVVDAAGKVYFVPNRAVERIYVKTA